ncbi:MAG: sugar-binding protein [Verrucomicrobiales bacterium]|nr:sugar-binding protein [Verrucomicrobiales bacterium]
MNKEHIYRVARTADRTDADLLEDFTFPWLDRDPPATKFRAWHDEENLYFEFSAEDTDIVLHSDGDDDTKVLGSDRVELFFASSPDLLKPYYGFEMDPRGLTYDYEGTYHRQFTTSWTLPGFATEAEILPTGYQVSGSFSLADLRALGCLREKEMITGVYRGEFSHLPDGSVQQDWISWVDPETETPDFHVPESFGLFVLEN